MGKVSKNYKSKGADPTPGNPADVPGQEKAKPNPPGQEKKDNQHEASTATL
jgi:hypothetical protein